LHNYKPFRRQHKRKPLRPIIRKRVLTKAQFIKKKTGLHKITNFWVEGVAQVVKYLPRKWQDPEFKSQYRQKREKEKKLSHYEKHC
jgi:hypothetical protein